MSELQGDIQQFINWEQESGETNDKDIKRLKEKVKEAIDRELTPRQREVLLIALSTGFSQKKIAEKLGVDKSTISRTIARAVGRLRKVLRYAV